VNPYAPPAAPVTTYDSPRSAARYHYRPLAALAMAVTIVLGLNIVVELAVAGSSLATISMMRGVATSDEVDNETGEAAMSRDGTLTVGQFVVGIAAVVCFCLLVARACRNALSFGQIPIQLTPGWAVGVFFIPILSWWKPYQAMKEIWRASAPDSRDQQELARGIVPALMPAWWAAFLAHALLGRISGSVTKDWARPQQVINSSQMDIVSAVATILAAVLAIALVRALARRQEACQKAVEARRAAAPPPAPPAPPSTGFVWNAPGI
jgi:hypothetical protein